jgi:hypothetical protein
LHNSKDPVDGNGRKADAYWTDVTKEYKTTKSNRRGTRINLKYVGVVLRNHYMIFMDVGSMPVECCKVG